LYCYATVFTKPVSREDVEIILTMTTTSRQTQVEHERGYSVFDELDKVARKSTSFITRDVTVRVCNKHYLKLY